MVPHYKPPPALHYFKAYTRRNGKPVYLGIVSADNKATADTRARYLYSKLVSQGEPIWAEPEQEGDNDI